MKPFYHRWNHDVTLLDSSMTFENIRFTQPNENIPFSVSENKSTESNQSVISNAIKFINTVDRKITSEKNLKGSKLRMSNKVSYFRSPNKFQKQCLNFKRSPFTNSQPTESSKSVFTNVKDGAFVSYDGINSSLSVSTSEYDSDKSFSPEKSILKQSSLKEVNFNFTQPMRLFNKYGKPLTDRNGRPLRNIFGKRLLVFNKDGSVASDLRGNQVFNSLGESVIYSATELHIPPTDDEPVTPVLDVDKKHILFLFDSKGHPLTDSLGRPLTNASGRLMFGMNPGEKINVENYKHNQLKSMYGKAHLENFVRRVQMFDSDLQPLSDEHGNLMKNTRVICNTYGMPMCDTNGKQLYFRYGTKIINEHNDLRTIEKNTFMTPVNSSDDFLVERGITFKLDLNGQKHCIISNSSNGEDKNKYQTNEISTNINNYSEIISNRSNINNTKKNESVTESENVKNPISKHKEEENNEASKSLRNTINSDHKTLQTKVDNNSDPRKDQSPDLKDITILNKHSSLNVEQKEKLHDYKDDSAKRNRNSQEAIILFDASKKMLSQYSSSCLMPKQKEIRNKRISHIVKRKPNKRLYTSNFIEYFKNALNIQHYRQNNNRMIFNDFGKPLKDIYGYFLYDKFGIPLTGAHGIRLSEKARHTLRMKLRNIPVLPMSKVSKGMVPAVTYKESHDQLGDSFYDKYGRPLYDLFGKLIYDVCGRPLTDAFGRPLIDAIGQPLMDSEGNILTSDVNSTNFTLTDIYGRRLYDKRGRSLFDSYGRPKYDIYTNAIYDSCGRPAADGNGKILYDFLNKPIQPYPEKPLYKNVNALLPKYIERILAMPSMHRVLKYSRATMKDVFGGPLFDDFGRPLYNSLGKPLFDKFGRPLYDKDGRPLCDCYGRPLSEEIRRSVDDQTLSVVDSLKLLKLTKESSKWMEIKRSQVSDLKTNDLDLLDEAIVMRVVQPAKHKSTQYTYALTRVTRFSCGRQALEILEAPLSPSTAAEMHHLPVDNKPLIMVARRRQKIVKKRRRIKYR